ncbi:MAG TPA: ferritin-like domain-containing protein, partial [Polyangiaceae bacterium]
LTDFLGYLGGEVQPMGRTTRLLFNAHARAQRMDTIVLTNLMFETIGSTTYRMALRRVPHGPARQMLAILTRDESFHVPLNVHFLRNVLARASSFERLRLNVLYNLLFVTLVALPLASRPKARAFDRISAGELSRAYARYLAELFVTERDLGLRLAPPLLWLFGLKREALAREASVVSVEAAERAAEREHVEVTAL